MNIAAKRVFRLSLVTALSLAGGYALNLQLPYLTPIFGFMFTLKPGPPMGLKGLIGMTLVLAITLGVGILYIPVLLHYPISGFLLVAVGLFLSNHISINKGQAAIGTFLTVGLTIISAAGVASFQLAILLIKSMIVSVAIVLVCQQLIYPFFPEDRLAPQSKAKKTNAENSLWLAFRATLIVLPTFFMALTNPSLYLPIILKAASLGQQDSISNAHHAGRELLGSTLLGGLFAIIFWFALKLQPNLYMFSLWALLFTLYFSSKFYRVVSSNFPPSFWQNVVITLLILLGPAVQDSAEGKDVYKAFAIRMGLFIAVTIYAWFAISLLDYLYHRKRTRSVSPTTTPAEPQKC